MVLKRQMLLANKKQESDASTLARESDGLPPNYAVPAFEGDAYVSGQGGEFGTFVSEPFSDFPLKSYCANQF
jgi:hypothetical protein